jgi:hypothetical protein
LEVGSTPILRELLVLLKDYIQMVPGSIPTDVTNAKQNKSPSVMTIDHLKMGEHPSSEMSCKSNTYVHQALDNVEHNYDAKGMGMWTDYSQYLTNDPHYKSYAHTY